MSKVFPAILTILFLGLAAFPANAEDLEATIALDFKASAVSIEGKFQERNSDKLNLSFLRSVAGIDNLGSRISALQLKNSDGTPVSFKRLADGEYLADATFHAWSYRVDLSPLKNRSAAAHVSWLNQGAGILMLADLLPLHGQHGRPSSARVRITFPMSFETTPDPIYTSEPGKNNIYEVPDVENALFCVGGWEGGGSLFNTNLVDLWILGVGGFNFKMNDAADMAREIYSQYAQRYGRSVGRPFVSIAKFPVQTGFGEWQAETRGSNVTIISSDMPFRTQSLQRLHEQLRHEMFHLWIPNGVSLTGNYDWFYEGFALYQSLKLAVALNRIRFEDFLDTLSRAHTIDSAIPRKTSLIQASTNRFSGSNTQVYARGMLVAFLCDVQLLQKSKRKLSVEDILLEVIRKYRKPQPASDGNAAVIKVLREQAGAGVIVDRYIQGVEVIDLAVELKESGIEDSDPGPITNLRVKEKLNGSQKSLLDKLGYNNWRNLSERPK